jgi:hypothetical protein
LGWVCGVGDEGVLQCEDSRVAVSCRFEKSNPCQEEFHIEEAASHAEAAYNDAGMKSVMSHVHNSYTIDLPP